MNKIINFQEKQEISTKLSKLPFPQENLSLTHLPE